MIGVFITSERSLTAIPVVGQVGMVARITMLAGAGMMAVERSAG